MAAEEEDNPGDWRTMTVALDQGSDGWSAMHWLLFEQRACVLLLRDPLHRLWNSTQNAVREAGELPSEGEMIN